MFTIYTDGSYHSETGIGSYGVVIIWQEKNHKRHRTTLVGEINPCHSPQQAELVAVEKAIIWVGGRFPDENKQVVFHIDREDVYNGLSREFLPKHLALRRHLLKIRKMMSQQRNKRWFFEWIPREENTQADALARNYRSALVTKAIRGVINRYYVRRKQLAIPALPEPQKIGEEKE